MPKITLTWDCDTPVDSFEVIRSDTSLAAVADVDLPTPIATGITPIKTYDDTTVVTGNTYYYKVRAKRGSVSVVSEQLVAIASDDYIFKTPFKDSLDDLLGKVWTKHGSASFDNAIHFPNTGSATSDYAVTAQSNISHIFSTDDFTLRMKVKFNRTTGVHILCACRNYGQAAGFRLNTDGSNLIFVTHNNSTTPNVNLSASVSLNTTDFFSISIERKAQKYYLYFEGNRIAYTTTAQGIKAPTYTPYGGMTLATLSDDSGYFLSGYIKDFELLSVAVGDGGSTTPGF